MFIKEKSLEEIVDTLIQAKENKVSGKLVKIEYAYKLAEAIISLKDSEDIIVKNYQNTICKSVQDLEDASEHIKGLQVKLDIEKSDKTEVELEFMRLQHEYNQFMKYHSDEIMFQHKKILKLEKLLKKKSSEEQILENLKACDELSKALELDKEFVL